MSRHSTCLPCRTRKVKCDGSLPHCDRCVRTNRSASCAYGLSLHPKRKALALQKGEACIPCRNKKKRCDATRPICQRCTVARYQDECVYDAAPPDPSVELSRPQARRVMARRTSLSGGNLRPRPALSDSSQSPPHFVLQSSHTLTTPPQPGYPVNKGKHESLVQPSQNVPSTASTSFAHVQPLQKRFDRFQHHTTRSHHQSHLMRHGQNHPSDSSSDDNEVEHTAQTSVVIRTTTLVPSSPLLKSTVSNSRASEAVPLRYPHDEYPIQADPKSPYYTFQDTHLIPNPIVRVYMANNTNPKMFSLQTISPDTLSLLFRFEFISHLIQFAIFLPVAKLQAIILGDTSGTFVHPCFIHLAHLIGCHHYQDNRLDYSLNHLELLHLNMVCHTLEAMDRPPQQQPQPRFHTLGQTHRPREEPDPRTQGESEDPFTYAQIRFLLVLFSLLWRNTNVASRLFKSVFSIVERNDIRFVPEHRLLQVQHEREGHAGYAGSLDKDGLPIPEFSESDYERVAFLATLIGADAGLQVFGLAREGEVSWLDLERQFFDELPVAYPTLAQMPLMWRNRGLLLMNHAISLQKLHKGGRDIIQSCKDLIGSHFFAIEGLPTIIALHEGDHEGHLILRCAAIIIHTAMAVLLRTLSQALTAGQGYSTVPVEDQALPVVYRRRCRKSLKDAIKITRGLADPDFPFIDVVMHVGSRS
ncbi:hypothetical protein BDM02DRAFT_261728 [Thelephora ganbajun]|uniref:Uncharacterized protein n=1 Tax=Thelephora ganbajun TaxID=370292 RepID=A0ACB6Z959_THEGA|nr:hypothetical protein BDM02DRAFT_261728 [Thelephora ganbajun]